MMDYSEWTFNKKIPIYMQLCHKFRYSILSGKLSPGENLPSIRNMAAILRLNSNTVARSYKLINQEDLIFKNKSKNYTVTFDSILVNQKRIQEARLLCNNLISVMTKLGFSKKDILSFVQKYSCSENITAFI